ncbi:hypothetical protein [Brucella tritici]|uniref:hypothetical protein n=1 Tax=Brucella tritici TaxID=94626 RepID=UPI003D6D3E15
MAPLPKPFDAKVHWIKDLLHRGKRAEALQMLEKALTDGTAGEETRALADYLRSAKKGRQPFGTKHLWFDIGRDDEDMQEQGMSRQERMSVLKEKYKVYDETKFSTWINMYERAMDEIRLIESENLKPPI